jgi:hypothetical protein
MKTSLGVDCVAITLDYDAVKEVVQIVSGYRSGYRERKLRVGEQDWNFRFRKDSGRDSTGDANCHACG